MKRMHFTSWRPLVRDEVAQHAPEGPAAVQVRVEEGLLDYPSGRSSAMVCYFYAGDSARETLEELFEDELDEPGVRGDGPLLFRFIEGGDRVLEHLKRRLHRFYVQFGEMPLYNQKQK